MEDVGDFDSAFAVLVKIVDLFPDLRFQSALEGLRTDHAGHRWRIPFTGVTLGTAERVLVCSSPFVTALHALVDMIILHP